MLSARQAASANGGPRTLLRRDEAANPGGARAARGAWSWGALAWLALALTACGGATANDDLGYDPAVAELGGRLEPLFDAPGLPIGSSGVPLRAEAVEGEWRTFRGNAQRSGTRLAPGIADPRIRWSVRVGIQGYANTPMVGDDAVFLTSQGNEHNYGDDEDGFYAINRDDGTQEWFFGTDEDVNGGALTDELVLGGTDDGTLYAIERDTGRERWQIEVGAPIHHGPLVLDELAYVMTDVGVAVIDVESGSMREIIPGGADSYDERGGLAADGDLLLRNSLNCRLDAWEGGDEAWMATVCAIETEEYAWTHNYTPPMVVGEAIVTLAPRTMDYDGAEVQLEVRQRDDGGIYWATTPALAFGDSTTRANGYSYDMSYHASLPWLMNGMLYLPPVNSPRLIGVDLATGRGRVATDLPDCRARQFASIVGVPTRGYFARHDGRIYGFSPASGAITWTMVLQYNASAGAVGAQPSYYDPYGYDDENYCAADPWDGSALFSTPAIGEDGTLYVGSGEGYLYAIEDVSW